MRFGLLYLLIPLAACLGDDCVAIPSDESGAITAVALDEAGRPIPSATVELMNPKSGRVIKAGPVDVPQQVPFGEYIVRVHAQGFFSESRTVLLDQAELVVRVRLHFAGHCAKIISHLSGTVTRVPGARQLWAKAVPMAGPGGSEVSVSSRGYFLFPAMKHGSYIVLVLDESSILHTQIVDLSRDVRLSIELR